MTSLSDIQLISKYQKTRDQDYYIELYRRYRLFLKKNSYRIYEKLKSFNNGFCLEDIDKEMEIALLKAICSIDKKKIKNESYFCFAKWIKYYIKNFENTNLQLSQCELDIEDYRFSSDNTNDLYKINYILRDFKKKLTLQEKKIFELRLQGKKLKEISSIIGLSRVRMSQIHLMLKRKYKEYILK